MTGPVIFHRCPDCGAVKWPQWPVTHRTRPPCSFALVDPSEWSTP